MGNRGAIFVLVAASLSCVSAAAQSPAALEDCREGVIVSAWTNAAKPGRTLFVVGEKLGSSPVLRISSHGDARTFLARGQWSNGRYLLATLPVETPAGPLDIQVGRGECWSRPFLVNAPELWWAWPSEAVPGSAIRLFGRNLDAADLRVELTPSGENPRIQLSIEGGNPYALNAALPIGLRNGVYRLTIRSGRGAAILYSMPFEVRVQVDRNLRVEEARDVSGLYRALRTLDIEGGTVRLAPGEYRLGSPLNVPAGVTIEGAGSGATVLRVSSRLDVTPGLVRSEVGLYAERFQLPEMLVGHEGSGARAAVLMLASNTGLVGVTIDAGGFAQQGVVVAGSKAEPISKVLLRDVRVQGLSPFAAEPGRTEAVLVRHVRDLVINRSKLIGNGPALFLEDVAGGTIADNILAGGGEGVITGREGGVRHLIIERNRFLSKEDGAPQAVRMMWLSTLFGSTYENYIEGNAGSNFHPPANTEQNRGEAILFETALSHPYYGHPLSASDASITLPDYGPDWLILDPNLTIRGTRLSDYFVVVVNGYGQGQVRRIVARNDHTLTVSEPWRLEPNTGSTVLLTELNYRNVILNNRIHDAMQGIVLWINGVENVIVGNHLSALDREGILVYGDALGGPQQMPRFWPIGNNHMAGWNRGIGPSYFNTVESNTVNGAQIGINITAGDFQTLRGPIDWPVSMGNSVQRNTVSTTRDVAISVGERFKYGDRKRWIPGATLVGTIVEDNHVSASPRPVFGDQRTQGLSILNNRFFGTGAARLEQISAPTAALDWLVEGNNFGVPRLTWPDAGMGGVSAKPAQ